MFTERIRSPSSGIEVAACEIDISHDNLVLRRRCVRHNPLPFGSCENCLPTGQESICDRKRSSQRSPDTSPLIIALRNHEVEERLLNTSERSEVFNQEDEFLAFPKQFLANLTDDLFDGFLAQRFGES